LCAKSSACVFDANVADAQYEPQLGHSPLDGLRSKICFPHGPKHRQMWPFRVSSVMFASTLMRWETTSIEATSVSKSGVSRPVIFLYGCSMGLRNHFAHLKEAG
jgi:hypothetical protein